MSTVVSHYMEIV